MTHLPVARAAFSRSRSGVRQAGFTLIELSLVLAAMAILSLAAYTTYSNHAVGAKRADGQAALLDGASRMERSKFENGTYALSTAEEAKLEGKSPEQLYQVSYAAIGSGRGFKLTATPSFKDGDCPTLTIDHLGNRGPSEDCW